MSLQSPADELFQSSKSHPCLRAQYNIDWCIRHYKSLKMDCISCWEAQGKTSNEITKLVERLDSMEASLVKLQSFLNQ